MVHTSNMNNSEKCGYTGESFDETTTMGSSPNEESSTPRETDESKGSEFIPLEDDSGGF